MNGFNQHWTDAHGNPAGGISEGRGFTISWQHGPLGRDEDRKEQNGAFVEDILFAVANRITFYQDSKFNCKENAEAFNSICDALQFLKQRTNRREADETEGTHKGN